MANIIASASVPPANRLIDADTTDLAAISRPADVRFPANQPYTGRATVPPDSAPDAASADYREGYAKGYADAVGRAFDRWATRPAAVEPVGQPSAEVLDLGRRVWELSRTYPKPLSDKQLAKRLGVSEADVNDALLAYMGTQPALADSLSLGRSVDARLEADPHATMAEVAADLGITVDQALDARNNLICWDEGVVRLVRIPDQVRPTVDWFDNPITEQCTVDWCRGDCVLGGPTELGHSRTLVEAEVKDGASVTERRRLLVTLQQYESPALEGGRNAATVYLSTGDTDAYGVDLDLDEAERLALAILAGVRAVRTNR